MKATELYFSVVLFAVQGGSCHARIVFGQIYCIALERVSFGGPRVGTGPRVEDVHRGLTSELNSTCTCCPCVTSL